MKITLCLFFLLSFAFTLGCDKGGLLTSQGLCQYPKYIEGCFAYAQDGSCFSCQYNYQINNGLCYYSAKSLSGDCCLSFDNQSRCLKCAPGLVLVSGVCQDIKIAGCLQKNTYGCAVCTKNYDLVNNNCVPIIAGCHTYSKSYSLCSVCSQGYQLNNGICLPVANTVSIPNCDVANQAGCVQCSEGYRSDSRGGCMRGGYGCLSFNNDGSCNVCDSAFYTMKNGVCQVIGCTNYINGVCQVCNQAYGFILASGRCVINNCIYTSNKGCVACDNGFFATASGCVSQGSYACTACRIDEYFTSDGRCNKMDVNCNKYVQDVCASCVNGYVLNNGRCIKTQPGCLYTGYTCTSCSAPFVFSNGRCFISGCLTYSYTGCTQCDSRLVLYGDQCGLPNCRVLSNFVCAECNQGFVRNPAGQCVAYDPNCAATSPTAGCLRCKQGYDLNADGRCVTIQYGCNYVDGKCTSCRAPFQYVSSTQSCAIDGCVTYFLGGCKYCTAGYILLYNSCKLPNCLVSKNGRCLTCDPDYIFKSDGTCVNKDLYCDTFDKDGNCAKCMPKYYMSVAQRKCILRDFGCSSYDNQDNCLSCAFPFFFRQGRCEITGCLSYLNTGCKQCQYPFVLNERSTCDVPHCTQYDNSNRCAGCSQGFALNEKKVCTVNDPNCCSYNNANTECTACFKGYMLDSNGVCQYLDQYCSVFDPSGVCMNCNRLYFLNPMGKCELRDPQCLVYTNGLCSICQALYYPKGGQCMPNLKGCANQINSNFCTACLQKFTLKDGVCIPTIKKLSWNDIDMDFFADDTAEGNSMAKSIFTMKFLPTQRLRPVIKSSAGFYFFSSSSINGAIYQIESQGNNGWSPNNDDRIPFIGVQTNITQTFYAVDIKILTGCTLKSFIIEYSVDGVKYNRVNTFALKDYVAGQILTFYFKPVAGKYIRFVPVANAGISHIRIEFYISDTALLNSAVVSNQNGSYISKSIVSTLTGGEIGGMTKCQTALCWAGIQSCAPRNMSGFSIVYSSECKATDHITKVKLQYSLDGMNFVCLHNCTELALNNSQFTLDRPLLAQKFRVHFSKYTGTPKFGIAFSWA